MRAEKDMKQVNNLVAKLRLLGVKVQMEEHQMVVKKTTIVSEEGITA